MERRPPLPPAGRSRVLGLATATTDEDPFGPGDPLEVARLVRRALAAAGRRAVDVARLVVVTESPPTAAGLVRLTRRALGPHGATVRASVELVTPGTDHLARRMVLELVPVETGRVVVGVVLGPSPAVAACCLGARGPSPDSMTC
jgi:hypothetical protein